MPSFWKDPGHVSKQFKQNPVLHDVRITIEPGEFVAIVGKSGSPRLLLLDEPLGALGALTRIEMQQLIENLWEKQRFTTLLVTHDVSEAVTLADRVLLIEQGEVALDVRIALGRPRERDSSFMYFENLILNRVLSKRPDPDEAELVQEKKLSYSI